MTLINTNMTLQAQGYEKCFLGRQLKAYMSTNIHFTIIFGVDIFN